MAKPHIRLQRPECCIRLYVDGTPSKESWSILMTLAAKLFLEPAPNKHTITYRNVEIGVDSEHDWQELKDALGAGERAWKAEQTGKPEGGGG